MDDINSYLIFDIETVEDCPPDGSYPTVGPRGGKLLHQGNQRIVSVGFMLFDRFEDLRDFEQGAYQTTFVKADASTKTVLLEALAWLKNEVYDLSHVVLIGWNSSLFDEAIYQRCCAANDIPLLSRKKHIDLKHNYATKTLWSLPHTPLAETALVFGFDDPGDDIDGSQVQEHYELGQFAKIEEHNRRDVERTAFLASVAAQVCGKF